MISRPDLLDARSPAGLEVFQLTDDPALPSCHIYMEAQIFTPDSQRLLLHRVGNPHWGEREDPRHRYQVCDLADGGRLWNLTDEVGAIAPSVAPDGTAVYYFVDRSTSGGGITLQRVNLDGTGRETLLTLDGPLPGTRFRASKLYSLSTISSDGRRLAISCFLGDGRDEGAPFGLLVFDLVQPAVELVMMGPTWCNMHPQYCRATDPAASHDILVQENHGCRCDAKGEITVLVSGAGADIHVVRDDGMAFRNLPWGRDGLEACQGHQCWIGRSNRAITSTFTLPQRACTLLAGEAAPYIDHHGIATPDACRVDLSRDIAEPKFFHFATDIAGHRLITDTFDPEHGSTLYLADIPVDGPLANYTYLLHPHADWQKWTHVHPFLSPDGTMGFFNSDESGVLQAYMVRLG
jgi:hypothetical protein